MQRIKNAIACKSINSSQICVESQPVQLDVPEVNEAGLSIAARLGLSESFGCARVHYGEAPQIDVSGVFGVTSFEFGRAPGQSRMLFQGCCFGPVQHGIPMAGLLDGWLVFQADRAPEQAHCRALALLGRQAFLNRAQRRTSASDAPLLIMSDIRRAFVQLTGIRKSAVVLTD